MNGEWLAFPQNASHYPDQQWNILRLLSLLLLLLLVHVLAFNLFVVPILVLVLAPVHVRSLFPHEAGSSPFFLSLCSAFNSAQPASWHEGSLAACLLVRSFARRSFCDAGRPAGNHDDCDGLRDARSQDEERDDEDEEEDGDAQRDARFDEQRRGEAKKSEYERTKWKAQSWNRSVGSLYSLSGFAAQNGNYL